MILVFFIFLLYSDPGEDVNPGGEFSALGLPLIQFCGILSV